MKVILSGYNYRHAASFARERPEGIGDYVLLIIRSPARITIDNTDHFVKGNNVIVYRKGSPQYFAAHNAEFVNDWVQFDLDQEDLSFCEGIGIPFDTILDFADVYPLSRLVELLWTERWHKHPNAEESKTLLLRLLLLKLSDLIVSKTAVSSHFTIELMILRRDISNYPHMDWSIESICKSISISPSYLHSSYKQLFGTTVKEDVIASRIARSKQLLSDTNHSVATIAHMVGYEDETHFMHIFKKKTGFTPRQYRKLASTHLVL